jgi:hypothetical protein
VYRGLGRLRSHPSNRHGDPTFANEQRTLPDVWVARCGCEIDALRTGLFHARATHRLMSFSLYTRVKNWTGKHTSPGVVVEPRKPAALRECWTAPETFNDE